MKMLATFGTLAAAVWGAGIAAQSIPPPQTAAIATPIENTIAKAIEKAIEKDRVETEQWLQHAPDSYLAAIDRHDFGPARTLTVGRAADNDLRLNDPSLSAHHLRVTVDSATFRVNALDPPARFAIAGKPEPAPQGTGQREAALGPSSIQVGRFLLRLSHQGFPALIVFDPESPHFKEYKGLKYFPIDLAYRYELRLTENARPEIIRVESTRGNVRSARRVGWFEFAVGGTPVRLEAVRLLEPGVGENDVSVFFRDSTTGHDSYPVGRYVDVSPAGNGKYVLDFNRAYNPACAFSDYYNCPIPSKANTLAVAIRAGEMDSHYH